MRVIFRLCRRTGAFWLSVLAVFLIALGLSLCAPTGLSKNTVAHFMSRYRYYWLSLRIGIIVIFFFVWPHLVNNWGKRYDWDAAQRQGIINRRWRYAIWLIVIDLTFQLL